MNAFAKCCIIYGALLGLTASSPAFGQNSPSLLGGTVSQFKVNKIVKDTLFNVDTVTYAFQVGVLGIERLYLRFRSDTAKSYNAGVACTTYIQQAGLSYFPTDADPAFRALFDADTGNADVKLSIDWARGYDARTKGRNPGPTDTLITKASLTTPWKALIDSVKYFDTLLDTLFLAQ